MCGEQGSSFGTVIQGFFTVNMDMAMPIGKNLELTAIASSPAFLKSHFWALAARSVGAVCGCPKLCEGGREQYFSLASQSKSILGKLKPVNNLLKFSLIQRCLVIL